MTHRHLVRVLRTQTCSLSLAHNPSLSPTHTYKCTHSPTHTLDNCYTLKRNLFFKKRILLFVCVLCAYASVSVYGFSSSVLTLNYM